MLTASELHDEFFVGLQRASRDTFLHHYTRLSRAFEQILPRQELRLGPFRDTNDPREYKDFNIRMAGRAAHGLHVYDDVVRLAQELLKDTWSLTCLTTDNPDASDPVSTWDRGWARSRMWAQYAENHRGVCLVFDRAEMMNEVVAQLEAEGDAAHGPVRYEDSSALDAFVIDAAGVDPANPLIAVVNQMWGYRADLFFLKAEDWQTEYEYRFLLRREAPAPYYVTMSSSLRGVVLGDAVSDAYRPSLDALCETLQVGAAQIRWTNGTPGLRNLARP